MTNPAAMAPALRAPEPRVAKRGPRWLFGTVILLAAGLLVAVSMLVTPMLTTTPGEAILNRLVAAWNDGDLDAVRELYAEDAFIWLSNSDEPLAIGIEEIVEEVQFNAQSGFRVELIGPVSEKLNLVWAPGLVTTDYDAGGDEELTVLVLEGGQIVQHWVIWEQR